jgi:hypothetical protein
MAPDPEIAKIFQELKAACRSEHTGNERVALRISGLVRRIEELAGMDRIRLEGDSVVAHAFKLYSPVDTLPPLIHTARLQAAVSRFELALRQHGLLDRRRAPRSRSTGGKRDDPGSGGSSIH